MKFTLKAYSIQEVGKRTDAQGNPHQEDSLFPAHNRQTEADRLFIVCDGMGGHEAGEVASAAVCEAMSRSLLALPGGAEGPFAPEQLTAALAAAYDALDARDGGGPKKMGTTMTLLKLHEGGATVAHIGDSRVYHIRPGRTADETRILFATSDHSLVNELEKLGEITHEEARRSRQRNVITRAMQPNQPGRCRADMKEIADIKPGDYFYLCTDGMLEADDMEDGTVLRRIFSETSMPDGTACAAGEGKTDGQRVEMLREATCDNHDNHTAILVHILTVDGEGVTADEEEPAAGVPAEAVRSEEVTAPRTERPSGTGGKKRADSLCANRFLRLMAVSGFVIFLLVATVFIVSCLVEALCGDKKADRLYEQELEARKWLMLKQHHNWREDRSYWSAELPER